MDIGNYKIQEWLFQEAEGKFEIDLAESGIQHHNFHDLDLSENYHLNYSLDSGDLKLRQIIAEKYDVSFENVMITNGSQEALYLFYRSLLKSGDNVLTFSPGWQQSWEVPKVIGASVTIVDLSKNNYEVDVPLLMGSINERTKLIVLNSPHNPTGKTIPRETLSEIKEFCAKKGIFVINDEEYLTDYSLSITQGEHAQAVGCVSSLSKIFGFPGLRLGWFVGPKEVVNKMINYRRYVTVCNSHLCERLAEQVFGNFQKYVTRYESMTEKGLELLRNWVRQYPQFQLLEPQGTPFAYVCVKTPMDTYDFSRKLLANQKVLIMPAEVFNDQNAFRLSFGRAENILNEGLARISFALKDLAHAA